jgi:hypothetical protein
LERILLSQTISREFVERTLGTAVFSERTNYSDYTLSIYAYENDDLAIVVEYSGESITRYAAAFKRYPSFLGPALRSAGLKLTAEPLSHFRTTFPQSPAMASSLRPEPGEAVAAVDVRLFGAFEFGIVYFFPESPACDPAVELSFGLPTQVQSFKDLRCAKPESTGHLIAISRVYDAHYNVRGKNRDHAYPGNMLSHQEVLGTAANLLGFWKRQSLRNVPRAS